VTPVIVVPGPWSNDDVRYQAAHIAGQFIINAGFNCLTPRVVVQQRDWGKRQALNTEINRYLSDVPTRYAYYPGAERRFEAFVSQHPDANQYGERENGHLPWTYVENVDPSKTDDIAFTTEAFCSLMTETALDAPDAASFLELAVDFVNEHLWGTLTALLIVHPASLEDAATVAAVERAIANLRYGSVAVNVPTAFGYALMTTSWGGHSGSSIFDVQSGIGVVNNTALFDGDQIQKSVLRAPFRGPLTQISVNSPFFPKLIRGMAQFEANPGLGGVVGALRSLTED
jgi:hypothetical protein